MTHLIEAKELPNEMQLRVRRPGLRYLDELLRLKCGPDLLELGLFPNAKEVTESFGAYHAARKWLRAEYLLHDPSVLCVVVGDGCTPRTAATFAFRSAWTCWSVDPRLRSVVAWSRIARLTVVPERVENFSILPPTETASALLVAVHSHAPLPAGVAAMPVAVPIAVIAIPCCVPQVLSRPPDVEYDDWGIASPSRRVMVWTRDPRQVENAG